MAKSIQRPALSSTRRFSEQGQEVQICVGVVRSPSPNDGINGGIDAAVAQARAQMYLDHGPFDKVFLFLAFEPEMRVFTLWP